MLYILLKREEGKMSAGRIIIKTAIRIVIMQPRRVPNWKMAIVIVISYLIDCIVKIQKLISRYGKLQSSSRCIARFKNDYLIMGIIESILY